MSYRLYDPAPVYLDTDGLTPCAGGKLYTYELGTTTPAVTYADPELTVQNANPMTLDSAGRANSDIWGDQAYTLVLKAADGRTVWTRDVDSGAGTGASIPPLATGEFLTNDGSILRWSPISEVPDPTGSENYVLTVLSGIPTWSPPPEIPEPPEPDWTVSATGFRLGDYMFQFGADTIPKSNSQSSSKTVSFPTPFTELQFVTFESTVANIGSYGVGATSSVQGVTYGSAAASFTATLNSADDGGGSGRDIYVDVPIRWMAYGKV